MAPAARTPSSRRYSACLTSSRSTTASTIQSQPRRSSRLSSMLPGLISRAARAPISGAGLAFFSRAIAASAKALRLASARLDDVEQHHVDPGIGDLGRDRGTHHAGANHRDGFDRCHFTRLPKTVAMPWPPPMHCVASAYLPPWRFSTAAALPVMRAPVAPSGWPSAIAPPSMLTVSGSRPRSWMHARAWLANASFSSTTSRSRAVMPARSSALREAPTGPMPMISGPQPATAIDLIRASTSSPCFSA